MTQLLDCPHLGGSVELAEERHRHIAAQHPDLLPAHRERLVGALADPDQVPRGARLGNARLFSRWYNDIAKHVVVVVISDAGATGRHWIVTACFARKLAGGTVEWQRN